MQRNTLKKSPVVITAKDKPDKITDFFVMWPNVRDFIHLSHAKIWLQNLKQQQEWVTVTFHKHESADAGVLWSCGQNQPLTEAGEANVSNGTEISAGRFQMFLNWKVKALTCVFQKKREKKTSTATEANEVKFVPRT